MPTSVATKSKPIVLFRDTFIFEAYEVLQESQDPNSPLIVKGIFQKSETRNGNGRIYPRSLWEKVVRDPQLQEKIKGRAMVGEVEHPADGMTNLTRVSHVITRLEMRGDDIVGEAEIFGTPGGSILKELFRRKVKVGISSRGKGTSFMKGNTEVVNDDYLLETFDFVYNPSTPGAYPSVVSEAIKNQNTEERSMADLAQLKRYGERMGEVLKLKEGATPAELSKLDDELIEAHVAVDKIVTEDPAMKTYGAEVSENIKKTRDAVRTQLTGGGSTNTAVPLEVYKKALAEAEKLKKDLEESKKPAPKKPVPKKEATGPLATDPSSVDPSASNPSPGDGGEEEGYEASLSCPSCGTGLQLQAASPSEMGYEAESCTGCGGPMKLELMFRRSGTEGRQCPNCSTGMELQTETGDHQCPKCGFKEKKLERLSRGELLKRHLAAVKIVEQLASKCRSLVKSNRVLSSRYESAVKLVGEAAQKNERVAVLARVREVVGRNPILKKVEQKLLTCRSVKAVDATVNEMLPLLRTASTPPKAAPKKESKDPLPTKGADNKDPKRLNENVARFPKTDEERQAYLVDSILKRHNLS